MDKKTVYIILGFIAGAYILKAFSRTVGVSQGIVNNVTDAIQTGADWIYSGLTGEATNHQTQQQFQQDQIIYPWLNQADKTLEQDVNTDSGLVSYPLGNSPNYTGDLP